MRMMSFGLVGLVLTCAGPARADETLEEVGRHLDNLVRQYRTIHCQIRVTSRMVVNGQAVDGSQDIDHEVLRLPDGRTRTRYETRGKSYRQVPGQGEEADSVSTLSIYDGQYLYDLRQTPRGVYAMKSRPDRNPYDPVGRLDIARRQFEARLLPDRTFEGKDVYAIEFVPRVSDGTSVTRRMVSYTDRHTGLPMMTISYNARGGVVNVAEVVESQLNEDIPADHFVFHLPPGVELIDMTRGEGQAGDLTAPASSPATSPAAPARAGATQAGSSSRPAGEETGR
jgi:outer membrane lipoprotein-sorting protein